MKFPYRSYLDDHLTWETPQYHLPVFQSFAVIIRSSFSLIVEKVLALLKSQQTKNHVTTLSTFLPWCCLRCLIKVLMTVLYITVSWLPVGKFHAQQEDSRKLWQRADDMRHYVVTMLSDNVVTTFWGITFQHCDNVDGTKLIGCHNVVIMWLCLQECNLLKNDKGTPQSHFTHDTTSSDFYSVS